MKRLFFCLLGMLLISVIFFFNKNGEDKHIQEPVIQCDTIYIRDTIRERAPVPDTVMVVRLDTIFFSRDNDTLSIPPITLPITRKIYHTADYRLIIEGYQPALIELDIFRNQVYYKTTRSLLKKPRWALTAGIGIGVSGSEIKPYIGVSLGYILWSK